MYVNCWQRRYLIDIIDVAGWQGECNNRHYTVVANSMEIALNQLAVQCNREVSMNYRLVSHFIQSLSGIMLIMKDAHAVIQTWQVHTNRIDGLTFHWELQYTV